MREITVEGRHLLVRGLTRGEVTAWIDLTGILDPALRKGADVLNGIAYDTEGKRLFVTGKLWPRLFEIEIIPKH